LWGRGPALTALSGYVLYILINIMQNMDDENTEKENNGYVVFKEISTVQLGNRVVIRAGGVTLPSSTPIYSRLLDRYLKTT
jgi:hypothetical protein